jgi:hypothetical protein
MKPKGKTKEMTMEVTIDMLNETDNPVGGELLGDDGRNQLWNFQDNDSESPRFANRFEETDGSVEWSSDEDVLSGWFRDNDDSDWIDFLLD